MTKRRIRTLLRSGWIEVAVPRKNLYKYDPAKAQKWNEFGDVLYMKDIIEWCQERFEPSSYTYSSPPIGQWSHQYENCFKRFVFRNEADAMVFSLKWSE